MTTQYTLHVDGALIDRPAVGGVLYQGGAEIARWSRALPSGTSQAAEIEAIRIGLSYVPRGAEVEIVSDSQYAVCSIDTATSGWNPRANQDLLQAARETLADYTWSLRWAPRRSSTGAEVADDLANTASIDPIEAVRREVAGDLRAWCPARPPSTMEGMGELVGLSAISVGRILAANSLKYEREGACEGDYWAYSVALAAHGRSNSGKTTYSHYEATYRADRVWRLLAAYGYQPLAEGQKRPKAVPATVPALLESELAELMEPDGFRTITRAAQEEREEREEREGARDLALTRGEWVSGRGDNLTAVIDGKRVTVFGAGSAWKYVIDGQFSDTYNTRDDAKAAAEAALDPVARMVARAAALA
jgi:ribonuclease HI